MNNNLTSENFKFPPDCLQGEAIRIRRPVPSDADPLKKWWGQREANCLDGDPEGPSPSQQESILNMIRRGQFPHWFIIEKNDGAPVGYILFRSVNFLDLSTEIALRLDQDYWDRGFGSEATKIFTRWLLEECALNRVWLQVYKYNERACRVYEKCGFKITGENPDEEGKIQITMELRAK